MSLFFFNFLVKFRDSTKTAEIFLICCRRWRWISNQELMEMSHSGFGFWQLESSFTTIVPVSSEQRCRLGEMWNRERLHKHVVFKRWKEPLRRIDSHPLPLWELFKEFKEVTCRSTTEETKKKGAVAAASYLSGGNVLSLCVKEFGVRQCWFLNVNLYLLNLFHFTFTSLIINSLTSRRHFFFPSLSEWAEGNLLYLVVKKSRNSEKRM